MNVEDLRYLDELLGVWEIGYPRPDGVINASSYAERLELRMDGTYSWTPSPLWARPAGKWGVLADPDTGEFKLYFETRRGGFRGEWLVITTFRDAAPEVRLIHWQRTVTQAVVFNDRILAGRWIGNSLSDGHPTLHPCYPHLVIRLFSTVYQREAVGVSIGEPAVSVVRGHCYVRHPAPFSADGRISADCRALLIAGVQSAVQSLKFRMCIVWAAASCTYVEAGAVCDAAEPPSGGEQSLAVEFTPQNYNL